MLNLNYNPKEVITQKREGFLGLLLLFLLSVLLIALFLSPSIGFYGLLAVTVIAGIATALFSHNLSLFILIFMIYIRISDIAISEFGLPSILQPMIVAIMGIVVVRFIATGQKIQGWSKALYPIGIYMLSILLSSFFADDFDRAKEVLLDFIPNILIVLSLIIIIQKESDIPIMVYGLLSAGILLGTISVIQIGFNFYAHDFAGFGMIQEMNIVDEIDSMRIGGSIGDPNIYAQVMLFIIPIAFERMINEKNFFLKLVAIWSFIATFLTVVFTYSRGAFIAMAIMGLFYVIYKKVPLKYLILGVLILSLLIPFLPSNYIDRILTIPQSLPFFGNSVKEEVSYSGRWSEMVSAIMMFLDHPLIGVGVNNYKYHYLDYARRIGTDLRGTERNPHILYLQILAEQGIIGFLAFSFIIYMMFRELLTAAKIFSANKKYKKYGSIAESVMIGMVGWLSAALFLHLAYPRYFWIIYAFAFSINKIPSLYPYLFSETEVE